MPSFQDLFNQHVATAMARQLALGDLIGERGWQADLVAGTVTFGDDLRFPIQLLGTESEQSNTWLWAWANTGSNLPPALLHLVGRLRDYGVPEFAERKLPLDQVDGHRLALVASGLTGRPYYRGPYDGGALFFHLEGVPDLGAVTPERALTVLTQVIQSFPVDHRVTATSFLQQQGWQVEPGAELIATHPDGSRLRLTFDDLGRITEFDGQIQPR